MDEKEAEARPVMGTIFLVGRAKRAPHWGVQSRFRVIYIYVTGHGKRAHFAHNMIFQ